MIARLSLLQRYVGLVDRHYTLNPKTDVLMPNGADLEDGMIVLVAPAVHRFVISDADEADKKLMDMILERNRWCTTSNVKVVNGLVYFTAVYPDGTQLERKYSKDVGWLVKMDSASWLRALVEGQKPAGIEKLAQVQALVEEAMKAAVEAYAAEIVSEETANISEQIADKIIQLF